MCLVENTTRVPTPAFAQRLDEALGTPGTFERMRAHLRAAPFPAWFRDWVETEREARALRTWHPTLVDGLLQTEEYARALLRTRMGASDDEVEQMAAGRMDRQAILRRDQPPLLWVVLDEAVLRRPIGGWPVMAKQLDHLVEMARTYWAVGAAAAMAAWLFTSGSPIRFTASITTLPPSAAAFAVIISPTAPPGTASSTTSASASASATGCTGAPPGPAPLPLREPYLTSCPAARHRPPSVPPTCPVPMTAIRIPVHPRKTFSVNHSQVLGSPSSRAIVGAYPISFAARS